MVRGWNDTARRYAGGDGTLAGLLAAQAARTPAAPAVRFADEALTYGELLARAARLARHLRSLGVGPEVRVGVAAERSLELVEALLAVLLAGGAYVPLDPSYPAERLAFMAGDAKLAVVLTQQHLAASLPACEATVVCLDAGRDAWAGLEPTPPASGLVAANAAYVIYTSGSTGRPKGAVNPHAAIVNRLLWMQQAYGLDAGDRVLQKTPFSFDVSVWELFWPLLAGATLVVARPEGHKDPAYLARLIEQAGVTTLHFVPPMLAGFLAQDGLAARCRSLRRVICSGEALPRETVERFFARMPRRRDEAGGDGAPAVELHNLYGPTEAAIDVTWWPCTEGDPRPSVPIGRPIANLRVHVLDRRGAPAPVGVAGELHLGGAGLARGYFARPGLTAERFVPDPLAADFEEPGGRLYRTGDLARLRPGGEVEFLGRLDHQVKVRGYRIETGEVEAALASHPAVAAAAVAAWGEGEERRLVAWVVPAGGLEADGAASGPEGEETDGGIRRTDLRAWLGERLPEYMVPSLFTVLAALPLTPNGKLDRRALPRPEAGRREDLDTAYADPAGELESTLAAMWRRVLKVERVGRNDDFFDLGGHSLLLTQVHQELAAEIAPGLDLVDLFQYRTVADLAAFLSRTGGGGPSAVDASRERGAARRTAGTGAAPGAATRASSWRWSVWRCAFPAPTTRRPSGATCATASSRSPSSARRRCWPPACRRSAWPTRTTCAPRARWTTSPASTPPSSASARARPR